MQGFLMGSAISGCSRLTGGVSEDAVTIDAGMAPMLTPSTSRGMSPFFASPHGIAYANGPSVGARSVFNGADDALSPFLRKLGSDELLERRRPQIARIMVRRGQFNDALRVGITNSMLSQMRDVAVAQMLLKAGYVDDALAVRLSDPQISEERNFAVAKVLLETGRTGQLKEIELGVHQDDMYQLMILLRLRGGEPVTLLRSNPNFMKALGVYIDELIAKEDWGELKRLKNEVIPDVSGGKGHRPIEQRIELALRGVNELDLQSRAFRGEPIWPHVRSMVSAGKMAIVMEVLSNLAEVEIMGDRGKAIMKAHVASALASIGRIEEALNTFLSADNARIADAEEQIEVKCEIVRLMVQCGFVLEAKRIKVVTGDMEVKQLKAALADALLEKKRYGDVMEIAMSLADPSRRTNLYFKEEERLKDELLFKVALAWARERSPKTRNPDPEKIRRARSIQINDVRLKMEVQFAIGIGLVELSEYDEALRIADEIERSGLGDRMGRAAWFIRMKAADVRARQHSGEWKAIFDGVLDDKVSNDTRLYAAEAAIRVGRSRWALEAFEMIEASDDYWRGRILDAIEKAYGEPEGDILSNEPSGLVAPHANERLLVSSISG
jgi:tetratricopeptide (TPR) repeat protein